MKHDLAWNSGKPYVQSYRPLTILWHTLLAPVSRQIVFHLTSLPFVAKSSQQAHCTDSRASAAWGRKQKWRNDSDRAGQPRSYGSVSAELPLIVAGSIQTLGDWMVINYRSTALIPGRWDRKPIQRVPMHLAVSSSLDGARTPLFPRTPDTGTDMLRLRSELGLPGWRLCVNEVREDVLDDSWLDFAFGRRFEMSISQ